MNSTKGSYECQRFFQVKPKQSELLKKNHKNIKIRHQWNYYVNTTLLRTDTSKELQLFLRYSLKNIKLGQKKGKFGLL
jgi:hypothetical protein